ncbi:MAG: cobalamin-dependent protein [Elusimicrobia bacterium]|nr:cobalamin-dependent protein [Elusimicrobiota bacterium]
MNILLIRPPSILGGLRKSNLQHPINIAILASQLIRQGFEVSILDCEAEEFSADDFIRRIKTINPKVIGFSCVTPHIGFSNYMAGLIKRFNPEIVTITGGPHPSVLPEGTLKEFRNFDIAVIGEGDITLPELCKRIEAESEYKDIPGIAYRENGRIVVKKPDELVRDLDSIGYPARRLLPLDKYKSIDRYKGTASPGIIRPGINATQIFVSRGCFSECIFCSCKSVFGADELKPKIRIRSLNNISGEVKECVEKYGFNHFSIEDEMFPADRELLKGVCGIFKKFSVTWNCNARVDILKREDFKMMSDSGCLKIEFGVESGSPRILSLLKKNISLEQIENSFRWAKESGIKRTAYLMLGSHPSEDKRDIVLTKQLVKRIEPDIITYTLAVPFPGTELHGILKQRGFLEKNKWENFQFYNTLPVWRTDNFTSQDLVKIQAGFLRWYYLSPKFIISKLCGVRSFRELQYYISTGIDIIKYLIQRKPSS